MGQALAVTDTLLSQGDTAQQWDSVVNLMAQRDPAAASRMVDRLQRLPHRGPQMQATMLLQDGYRLARIDTARAARRFRETMEVAGKSAIAGRARLALVQMDLARASDPSELKSALDTLRRLVGQFDLTPAEIDPYSKAVEEVYTAASPAVSDTSPGDLRLFLAAELSRDVLHAPRLAGVLFRRTQEQWPSSPYAPKAVLAAQQLDPTWIDSARVILDLYYGDSPYLAAVRGEMTAEYRQLEDSLGAFAASLAVSKAPPQQRRPPTLRPGVRRPQPAAGGSRVPEAQ